MQKRGETLQVIEYVLGRLEDRQQFGLNKYNTSIDECDPPTGTWAEEVEQELLDALQYKGRWLLEVMDYATSLQEILKKNGIDPPLPPEDVGNYKSFRKRKNHQGAIQRQE